MGEFLENVTYEKADASDQVEQTEETLLTEIKKQVTDIQLDSIDNMTEGQLATFMEKEFQTTDGKWLTYPKMKEKGSFYAFSLESAMDFISDKLGDKKYTEEGVEDTTTDGTGGGKTLDDRLKEYGGVDATDDEKNVKIVTLLQKIFGITADGYAGPETMANITAYLNGTALTSIDVDGYDENNKYGYTTISTLVTGSKEAVDTGEIDVFENNIMSISTLDALPKNDAGEYKRDDTKVYDMTIDGVLYRFYGNGRVDNGGKGARKQSKDLIKELGEKTVVDKIRVESIDILPAGFLDNPTRTGTTPATYEVKTDGTDTYSSYIFYNNGRVKKVKNNDYNDFDMDYSINVTKKMAVKEDKKEVSTEAVGDVAKELDSDMYDKYTDKIEKIKTSDFIAKYKSTYPGIEKCFANTLFVTINEDNPYFKIMYKNSDTYAYNNTQTGKISMRSCMNPDTYEFDQDKFFEKLLVEIQPTIEANADKERNAAILKLVRGKKFSKSDLFGSTKDKDARYTTYFEAFSDNLAKIDSDISYTKIEGDVLKFDLDDYGLDKDYNKNQSLALDKITTNSVLDENKLKVELAKIITNIIDTNLS